MKEYKRFEFIPGKSKTGVPFIKIITWIPDADGYIEIARIRMTKQDIVANNISVEELIKELQR